MRYDVTLPQTSTLLFRNYLAAALGEQGFVRVFGHFDPGVDVEVVQFCRGDEIISLCISAGDIVRRVIAQSESPGLRPLVIDAFKKTARDWLTSFLTPLVDDPESLEGRLDRWLGRLIEEVEASGS